MTDSNPPQKETVVSNGAMDDRDRAEDWQPIPDTVLSVWTNRSPGPHPDPNLRGVTPLLSARGRVFNHNAHCESCGQRFGHGRTQSRPIVPTGDRQGWLCFRCSEPGAAVRPSQRGPRS